MEVNQEESSQSEAVFNLSPNHLFDHQVRVKNNAWSARLSTSSSAPFESKLLIYIRHHRRVTYQRQFIYLAQ
jgi:hypothetical protein